MKFNYTKDIPEASERMIGIEYTKYIQVTS